VCAQLLQQGGVVVLRVGVVSAVAECVGMQIGRQVVVLVHSIEQLGGGCTLLGESYIA
jgi:putative Mn2+ efflux pump MntP